MPACSSENLPRFWSSSPPISRSSSVSPPLSSSPSSPLSRSPPVVRLTSPVAKRLKRSTSVLSNSSSCSRGSTASSGDPIDRTATESLVSRVFSWYFGLTLTILRGLYNSVGYVVWAPALWISAWICVFWVILRVPVTALKWSLGVFLTWPSSLSERTRNKRCVLITGGGSVQAVHLARNFYKAGARVVVCEVEGLFGLARFSIACSKFYTVPRPGPGSAVEYIKALKDIVLKERAVYFIPVSSSNTAYYDALAKPHLEPMGCECFVPGASEVTALDDPLELLRRCQVLDLPVPEHFVLRSAQDVSRFYERQTSRNSRSLRSGSGRFVMLAAGPAGMRDRAKILLPSSARELRNLGQEISESRPWVVIRDPGGDHFVTCTTVKESRVVANVTCRVDEARGLILEDRPEVTRWLDLFFARSFGSKMNGHLSFRLALEEDGDQLLSIGCRVGLSFPYVCHTGIHPRLVWKPCRHFSRQNSNSALLVKSDRCFFSESSSSKRPEKETTSRFFGSVLDKREALFVYWDPLPYCAYYHLQLPFRRVAGAIRAQPAQHNPPLAVVQ